MKIIIRADSSIKLGAGHVMRCLTLANGLRQKGYEVQFISRELPGNLCNYLEANAYNVHRLSFGPYKEESIKNTSESNFLGVDLEQEIEESSQILKAEKGINWLIVDHYSLDIKWEEAMKKYVPNIMVIDDLANRKHYCNLLLDQNYYFGLENRYDELIPRNCKTLLGPRYALLRPEFKVWRNVVRDNEKVKKILIFFGGSDPTNETLKAIKAFELLKLDNIEVDVIVGTSNPNKDLIRSLCENNPQINFHCQVENMAQLMAQADLAIGAGGTATWERCFLGLPTITVVIADNQYQTTKDLAESGVIWNLGYWHEVKVKDYKKAILKGISNPELFKKLREKAYALMGEGQNFGTDLVVEKFLEA